MVKKRGGPSAIQARIDEERALLGRYRDVLGQRIAEGAQASPHVHRGLSRSVPDEDEDFDGTRAEQAIFGLLRAIQSEQQALRAELERQGALLDELSRRGL